MVFVWQEAEGKLFCDVICKFFSILSFFCVQLNLQKMSWKDFMKSWLVYQAQNAEIKTSTATSMVACNISKILSKARYTRVDIGVCRKLFSTDLFCAPLLVSPEVLLQLSCLGTVLFACIFIHIQGFVCVCFTLLYSLQSGTPDRKPCWSWLFTSLDIQALCRIRYMTTELKIM